MGLDQGQLRWIDGICQSQLGLSSDEQPIYGPGNADLDTNTENHYEGCVASLSRTLRDSGAVDASVHADAACKARGLPDGSPALARCVLESERSGPARGSMPPAKFMQVAHTVKPGSFYWMYSSHQQGREEDACAALGINPIGGAFDACVKSLRDTFYSIDNPNN